METTEKIRCLIVGSGPAGYTAAPTSLPYCMKGYNPEVN